MKNKLLTRWLASALVMAILLPALANASTITMQAPGGVTGVTFVPESGNTYISDAYGFIKGVTSPDAVGLMSQNAVPLGQLGGRNNNSATTNPGSTNDNTQDYVIGSEWFNKSTGGLFKAETVGTGTATWSNINAASVPGLPWVAGQAYGTPPNSTLAAVLTVTQVITAYPVFIPNAITLQSISVSVTTGQTGGKVRAALYADTGAGAPGTMVTGTDTGDLTATGTAVVGSSAIAIAVPAGWYWVGITQKATTTMPSVVGATAVYTSALNTQLGNDTPTDALATSAKAVTGVSATLATYPTSTMPTTFPATGYAQAQNVTTPVAALGL